MKEAKAPAGSVPGQEKWLQLAKRAEADPSLMRQLLNDPKPVLEAEGIEMPQGSRVRVVQENSRLTCTIEAPAKASGAATELSEREMSEVVGGGGKADTAPTESITFEYGALQVKYVQQKE